MKNLRVVVMMLHARAENELTVKKMNFCPSALMTQKAAMSSSSSGCASTSASGSRNWPVTSSAAISCALAHTFMPNMSCRPFGAVDRLVQSSCRAPVKPSNNSDTSTSARPSIWLTRSGLSVAIAPYRISVSVAQ